MAFLMLCWGAITIATYAVRDFAGLTVTRFLLGLFEAGLFPGMVYYMTFWYRVNERSIRVAIIIASATLAGAFGGAIAYGISHMNLVRGLSAWRWLFILEGVPSCLAAFAVWAFLPDFPETASWLTPAEKKLAAERLAFNGSKYNASSMTWEEAKETLKDWRLYIHYIVLSPAFFPPTRDFRVSNHE
jgi:MFS family permease